jgi:ribulose-phosphate 3-epimerase
MAREAVRLPLNVHLMVTRPDELLDAFCKAGSDTLLIHAEARCDVGEALARIRDHGVRPGITLNPETPAEAGLHYADAVDEILCMTVHPGFGGQVLIPEVLDKITRIRKALPEVDLSVDGGINDETAADCAAAGANLFVAGAWLYGQDDMAAGIRRMRERIAAAWAPAGAS